MGSDQTGLSGEVGAASAEELSQPPSSARPVDLDTPDELLAVYGDLHDRVAATLAGDFRRFDRLLLRLHYMRGAELPERQKSLLLHFLARGYALSRDVRYYNELLWFARGDGDPLVEHCTTIFEERLSASGHHPFPLATRDAVERQAADLQPCTDGPSPGDHRKLSVALLGAPFNFTRLHRELETRGCDVSAYHVAGGGRGFRSWAKSNRFATRAACVARGCFIRYQTLGAGASNPHTSEVLTAAEHDLAFHRLNVIIRRNLIDAFRLGILNDIWGSCRSCAAGRASSIPCSSGFPSEPRYTGSTKAWTRERSSSSRRIRSTGCSPDPGPREGCNHQTER